MSDIVEIGRYIYLIFGMVGFVIGPVGFMGFWRIEKQFKKSIPFLFVTLGAIISLLLFASTFGRIVW